MPEKVFVYALSTCGHCRRTKQFLNDHNIPFDFVDVDLSQGPERTEMVEKVKSYNPACTFPTVLIGDKVIVGFREEELKSALGLT